MSKIPVIITGHSGVKTENNFPAITAVRETVHIQKLKMK